MSSLTSRIVRPVGHLERMSTALHHLGYYRGVAITARYKVPRNVENLSEIIEEAIASVVLKHAALCCGIINEDNNDTNFVRLDSINLSQCIEYRQLDIETEEEYTQSLIEVLEHQHGQLWPDLGKRPGWKVFIIQSKSQIFDEPSFDAIFAYHHAFADGLSGLVFHYSMFAALNNPSDTTYLHNHIVQVPDSITLASSLEEAVDLKISWSYLFWAWWDENKPTWLFPKKFTPWAGNICTLERIEKYKSRVKLITLPGDLLSNVLKECRSQRATLTGLLHGLIVASLSSNVPSAKAFATSTPYSLRDFSGLHLTNEMGVHVSSIGEKVTPETVTAIRASSDPAHLLQEIWKIARGFRATFEAVLAHLPYDSETGLFPYVGDMIAFYQSKIGKPRPITYEISNLGVMKNERIKGNWEIDQVVFTESGLASGPTMCWNVASVVGGPLTISLTWLEGDLEEELTSRLVADVDYALKCIGEGRDISF